VAKYTCLSILLLWVAAAALSSLPALLFADPLSITVQIDNPSVPGGDDNGNSNDNGGGGGGGGGSTPTTPPSPTVPTTATFSGTAYPDSRVTVLRDGQIAATTVAGPDAHFQISLTGLAAGSYMFSLYGEDDRGRRSNLFTFPITLTDGAVTTISGIFIAPTIDLDKAEVRRGDTITVIGQSVPDAAVTIAVNSAQELFITTTANADGAYMRQFDTTPMDIGDHNAKAKAASQERISPYGQAVGFKVGTRNVGRETVCNIKADLSGDCKVNLVDFSILAYWYHRADPPANMDLSGDGKVDIVDFSIMAYYWTG
jgi:hypothetical protein